MDSVFELVLAKNPDDRYQSCIGFVVALEEAMGGDNRSDIYSLGCANLQGGPSTGSRRSRPAQIRHSSAPEACNVSNRKGYFSRHLSFGAC